MSKRSLKKRAAEIVRILDNCKPLYKELDEITTYLVESEVVEFKIDGRRYLIVDNFAAKNTQFKASFMRRYEVKAK